MVGSDDEKFKDLAKACMARPRGVASPSFPLVVAAGFLRAGSDAIDLAVIALPTDKNPRRRLAIGFAKSQGE
jgi:hypothetical protein